MGPPDRAIAPSGRFGKSRTELRFLWAGAVNSGRKVRCPVTTKKNRQGRFFLGGGPMEGGGMFLVWWGRAMP